MCTSARLSCRDTLKTPCSASSARSGSCSRVARINEALDASLSNVSRTRSSFQRPSWTMPSARKAATRVNVTPTGTRRGLHSERGRPINVSAIGVAISRPARSPIQYVVQVNRPAPGATAPVQPRTSEARLAATMLLARHAAMKRATSTGSVQYQRPGDITPHERRADGRLQCRAEGHHQRHGQGGRVDVAACRDEDGVDAEGTEGDRTEHRPAVDQDAGQGDAGGRVQRRRIAGRHRQQTCGETGDEIGERGRGKRCRSPRPRGGA